MCKWDEREWNLILFCCHFPKITLKTYRFDFRRELIAFSRWFFASFFALHGESKELSYTFVHNFDERWQIFKLLLLLYSPKICNKTHAALPSTPDYVAALSCVCSKKSDAKIQITITTAYQFKNSCCSETLRRILLKFAIFTSERWQLKLLRGYLILIRYAVVTVIWILASRFWNTVYTDSLRTDHGVFSLD